MTSRKFFHYVSYLQYPMMLLGLYFIIAPFFLGLEKNYLEGVNRMLVFTGLGISFSTLQDTTTTQNEFSRKIWESPKKGKMFLVLMASYAVLFIILGMIGLFTELKVIDEIALGTIVLGIGMIGQLKVAIEMFENHRLDKNPPQKIES